MEAVKGLKEVIQTARCGDAGGPPLPARGRNVRQLRHLEALKALL